MTQYTLYGIPASRAIRNIWMFEELGVPYTLEQISYKDPALKAPPYTDMNPNGTIPFLTIDGRPMFESLAINLYLSGKHQRFCGTSAEEGGLMAQWTLWAATTVEQDVGQWFYNAQFLPENERKPEVAVASAEKLKKPLGVLNTILSKRQWLVGNDFSVADLNVAAVCFRTLAMPNIDDFPHVKAWVTRCWSRPAALKARRMRGDDV